MPTINDIDLGSSHPWPIPDQQQTIGAALVEGSRTLVWPRGALALQQDVTFYVTAFQGIGGQAALSLGAARYLVRQLEELASNPDMQPAYIQWWATSQSGGYNAADYHDGWYVIEKVIPNYRKYIVTGVVSCELVVRQVAPATPSSLGLGWVGAALSSTFTATPVPLLSYPIGATLQVPAALSRTGGEGAVPTSVLASASTINPALFVRPGTIAGLWTGGVRVYDSINTSSNPVPTSGGFAHANWVQVYGTQHDFVGDCILTNGLLLLLFQVGTGSQACVVYLWNTQLGTPAWQSVGRLQSLDNALNNDTVREINLDRVGLQQSRVRIVSSSSAGNYNMLRVELVAGSYAASVEAWPRTQANTSTFRLNWAPTNAAKIIHDDIGVADVVVSPADSSPAASPSLGFATIFGRTANGPLYGFLYQNAPSQQPTNNGSASIGLGDNSGPAQNSYRLYGIWAAPFVTVPNLQAEGESGSLGTGWSSVADGAASAGNAAKVASGTGSGNADLFGTSWVPPPGQYGPAFRLKVTSAASTTAQLQAGLWDATAGAFVTGASTIYAPSQLSTSYVWVFANRRTVSDAVFNSTTTVTSATALFTSADVGKVVTRTDGLGGIPAGTTIQSVTNSTTIILTAATTATGSLVGLAIGGPITPTAGHNMQFRAVTTATLGTDFFVDEAVLAPIQSATLGQGNFPGDIWAQWAFETDRRWVRG